MLHQHNAVNPLLAAIVAGTMMTCLGCSISLPPDVQQELSVPKAGEPDNYRKSDEGRHALMVEQPA